MNEPISRRSLRTRRWHERYLDYRLLAEFLRQLRFLLPLGMITPFTRVPEHKAYVQLEDSWVYWLFKAIIRDTGMMPGRFTAEHLSGCRDLLCDGLVLGTAGVSGKPRVDGQAGFHARNAVGLRTLDRNLSFAVLGISILVVVACAVHLKVHDPWLILVAATGPALAAALEAVRSREETERVEKRSEAMHRYLEKTGRALRELHFHPAQSRQSEELRGLAHAVTACMVAEALDWRIMFSVHRMEFSV
jgi:hypothetical protein